MPVGERTGATGFNAFTGRATLAILVVLGLVVLVAVIGTQSPISRNSAVPVSDRVSVPIPLDASEKDDTVEVHRKDGTTAVFRVDEVGQYDKDAFPTDTVYGPTSDAEIRLITCGGVFNSAERQDRRRLPRPRRLTPLRAGANGTIVP